MGTTVTQALDTAVQQTLTASFIGFGVSCIVFGVLTMLTHSYFQNYYSDRSGYKVLVIAIWALEFVDQTFIAHSVYFYAITNFGQPLVFLTGDVIWSLILQLILGVTVGTVVKCCFAYRVWRFSGRNYFIVGLIVLLTFGQCGLAILYAIRAFELKKFVFASELTELATLSLGSGVLTDFLIALALCYYLRKLRTGYSESDTLVNTLTIYTINTGIITSAISLTTLVLYNIYPTKFLFIGTYFVLSKFYAISYICTLNTRRIVRGRGTDKAAPSALSGITAVSNDPTSNHNDHHHHHQNGNRDSPTVVHVHGQRFNMLSPTVTFSGLSMPELSYGSYGETSVVVHHGHSHSHGHGGHGGGGGHSRHRSSGFAGWGGGDKRKSKTKVVVDLGFIKRSGGVAHGYGQLESVTMVSSRFVEQVELEIGVRKEVEVVADKESQKEKEKEREQEQEQKTQPSRSPTRSPGSPGGERRYGYF